MAHTRTHTLQSDATAQVLRFARPRTFVQCECLASGAAASARRMVAWDSQDQ